MTDYVWVVELAIKDNEIDAFKALAQDMVTAIEANEPNTLNYELFIADDEKSCHIYEQYTDGDAFKAHLNNFNQHFAERFGATVEVTSFTVYGNPNAEIRELLDDFGATILTPLVGVIR